MSKTGYSTGFRSNQRKFRIASDFSRQIGLNYYGAITLSEIKKLIRMKEKKYE
jgi:hypothetical protein